MKFAVGEHALFRLEVPQAPLWLVAKVCGVESGGLWLSHEMLDEQLIAPLKGNAMVADHPMVRQMLEAQQIPVFVPFRLIVWAAAIQKAPH